MTISEDAAKEMQRRKNREEFADMVAEKAAAKVLAKLAEQDKSKGKKTEEDDL